MSALYPLLESFYERLHPRGVAFVGSARFGMTIGHVRQSGSSTQGFAQTHSEDHGVSSYSSYFGWGTFLVAEFDFQEEYPPPEREWIAFARLAARVQRVIDAPGDQPDVPTAGVPVAKPDPTRPRPRPLGAEAPFRES